MHMNDVYKKVIKRFYILVYRRRLQETNNRNFFITLSIEKNMYLCVINSRSFENCFEVKKTKIMDYTKFV